MNYLAHAYLSFGKPALLTGNLISDFVKGNKRYDYPPAVQQGISLHRAIDEYTDAHDGIRSAKAVFRPTYRLYAGAFVDVTYDHFLANDPLHFENEERLAAFTAAAYDSLLLHYSVMPASFCGMFDRMRQQNWLFNYRFMPGMEKSFSGLVYRSKYLQESATAFDLFLKNYAALKESYEVFFPDLYAFAQRYIQNNFEAAALV